ncbi:MAG: hypothetical protein KME47_25970 [Nodosilinea sp. WJT8-NPBG4]|jgi:hypothetical protein|nr:hypothetical protein [Nodosilinea sp. WJT8-NPBG4]
MALVEPSVLANSVMAKLYDVLTNGDDTVPKSEDNFLSWSTPGIPVDEADFDFLSQGLTGVVKKPALDEMRTTDSEGNTTNQPEITPALLEGMRAQDTARLYMQAEAFARLVDFVPDLAKGTNEQFKQLSVMNNEGSLSDRYEYILRMSQVMQAELPEATKKKIEKFRGLLSVIRTKKNLIDDSETQVAEPSPLVQIYNEKLKAYEDAALEYNSHRIDALAADNAKAIHYWAINANILRNRVKGALTDWVTNGYKNDYEQIAAFIDQVMQRDMSLLKEQYRDDLAKARLTGLASGSDFYYSSLVPGNFIRSSGWTEYGFSASDYNQHSNSSYRYDRSSTSGGGGFLWFGGGGSASNSSSESTSNIRFDSEHFGLKFKIAQVPIVRPWLKTAFLMSKSWRFDQNNPEAQSEMVSDGGSPAKGLIPAYPTSIIFIKDLELSLGKSSGFTDFHSQYQSSSASGGGYVSFGPFHLGGSHGRKSASGEQTSNYHYDADTQTMKVPGTQIIGFKCHVLPKSPNPLSSITSWI